MVQALSALSAAHRKGIIHRDLKPENILLIKKPDEPDFVKLLDFGLSKLLSREGGVSPLTQTGSVLGTPHYMSPEQAVGAQKVSPRSDIYSMGVLLFQMLTGHLPFNAPNYNALMIKILIEPPADPAEFNKDIPDEMVKIIKKATARKSERRFKDCLEFQKNLLPFTVASKTKSASTKKKSPTTAKEEEGVVYDALFVGLGQSEVGITLDAGRSLKIRTIEKPEKLLEVLGDFTPHIIVSGKLIDLAAIQKNLPKFRTPVVLININDSYSELTIHEWDPETKNFIKRNAALVELDEEIDQLCSQRRLMRTYKKDIKNIGFHNVAEGGEHTVHVDTEVFTGDSITIKTNIWKSGALIDSISQISRVTEDDIVSQLTESARAQHAAAMQDAKGGKYG